MTDDLIVENCRFCTIPEPERVVARTKNCFAMLSLGPIVDGYSLVLTNEHVSCCGAIDSKILPEFEQLVKAVMKVQCDRFGSSVFYEHGRAGSCISTDGSDFHCHHAHLHVVPISDSIQNDLKVIFDFNEFQTWGEFVQWYERTELPYLLVGNAESLTCFIVKNKIERQFLRRIAANSVGQPHLTDWQKHPGREQIAGLVNDFRHVLAIELEN